MLFRCKTAHYVLILEVYDLLFGVIFRKFVVRFLLCTFFVMQTFTCGQVWLGIPAYGYAWPEKGRAKVISARKGIKMAGGNGGRRHSSGTVHFRYKESGKKFEVYFADAGTRRMLGQLRRNIASAEPRSGDSALRSEKGSRYFSGIFKINTGNQQ